MGMQVKTWKVIEQKLFRRFDLVGVATFQRLKIGIANFGITRRVHIDGNYMSRA